MSAAPIAFLTRPLYLGKPWGGRRLEAELGRSDVPPGPIGEAWEASSLSGALTLVEGGPRAGETLEAVLGAPFPLLIKVLDAREDLSVQVHPDGRGGPAAKEEAWVALGEGGAVAVATGPVAPPADPAGWLGALPRTPLRGPRAVPPRAPSLVHVPAGSVHAILAGSLVWEVQTPVDLTWRLYDHGRLGLDGRPRALHTAEAAGVLGRGPEGLPGVAPDGLRLSGRRFGLRLEPPGAHRLGGALALFATAPARVTGPASTLPFDVPRGRTAVLSHQALAVESGGWVLLADGAPGEAAVGPTPGPRGP